MKKNNNTNKLKDLELDLLEVQSYDKIKNDKNFNKQFYKYLGIKNKSINIDTSEYKEKELTLRKQIEKINKKRKKTINNTKKLKPNKNKYYRKQLSKQKLEILNKKHNKYNVVTEKKGISNDNKQTTFLARCYTNKTKLYKKISNKKIRQKVNLRLNRNKFKKIYDYQSNID